MGCSCSMFYQTAPTYHPVASPEVTQNHFSEVSPSKKHALNGNEQKGILRHLIEGADLSLWGMANAFTRHSQDVESYDRATELEAIGGNIITLARSEYRELLAA